jgi:nucleoside-diphosphate-sugar epimerase
MSNDFAVYGSFGFIGNELCKRWGFIANEENKGDRNKWVSKTNKLVYLISTVHNYNVLDNDPYTDIATNLKHLMTVLQANKIKYGNDFEITFVSSWFVYGKTECPARETSICNPTGFYSITKRAAEQLLISYCETFGIKWKIVRLSNVMGIGDGKISKRKNALQYMVKTLCDGGVIDLYKGDTTRDYINVWDAARGIAAVANKGKYGEIYNVGSGYGSNIRDLALYAHELTDKRGTINDVEVPAFHKQVQVENMWLECDKVFQDTGWFSGYAHTHLIEELVNHYMGANG